MGAPRRLGSKLSESKTCLVRVHWRILNGLHQNCQSWTGICDSQNPANYDPGLTGRGMSSLFRIKVEILSDLTLSNAYLYIVSE